MGKLECIPGTAQVWHLLEHSLSPLHHLIIGRNVWSVETLVVRIPLKNKLYRFIYLELLRYGSIKNHAWRGWPRKSETIDHNKFTRDHKSPSGRGMGALVGFVALALGHPPGSSRRRLWSCWKPSGISKLISCKQDWIHCKQDSWVYDQWLLGYIRLPNHWIHWLFQEF